MAKYVLARILWVTAGVISFTACQTHGPQPINEQAGQSEVANSKSLQVALDKRGYCGAAPLVIAHRGASGYVPEHTLTAYKLGLDQGADYIEPDLVMTKDHYLIARHENEMSETTDVAQKFPKRKSTKTVDGITKEGWYAEDFTLAEIKTLRAKERLAFRNQTENGLYEVPTFEEILTFVKLQERQRGRKIGVVPELKHSSYHHSIGHKNFEREAVRLLHKYDFKRPTDRAMIQSFEVSNLKVLRGLTKLPLVQLLDDKDKRPADREQGSYAQMATPEGLKAIREYADWVAPHKSYIIELKEAGEKIKATSFVADAHNVGLKVVTYTFRSDAQYVAKVYGGDPAREYRLFFNQGLDAVFTDFPDHALVVKKEFEAPCP